MSRSMQLVIKSIMDRFIAGLMLIALLPLLLLLALFVALFMGRPVLFSQDRPGKHDKIFKIYKFRTMKEAYDKHGHLLQDDQRMSKFGTLLRQLSLDELPELINIVKGEMSFVGPRPLLVEYLDVYTEEERHRHDMLPGLTGWAQVNGRNAISWKQKLKYDLDYINQFNLMWDLKIIGLTVLKVVKRSDIAMEGHVTTEKYNGRN